MKELKLEGEYLDSLLEFLRKNYNTVETPFEKNIDSTLLCVFLSERHINWPSFSYVGCCVVYDRDMPNKCTIRIYGIGGGRGYLNVGSEGGQKRVEENAYEDIQKRAQELRLKEI